MIAAECNISSKSELFAFSYKQCSGLDKQNIEHKIAKCSYPSVLTYILGAQKNRLIETVLLSTHNIWFG